MSGIYKTVLEEVRAKTRQRNKDSKSAMEHKVVRTNYTSLPVSIPDSFLAPLPDPSTISVNVIDFANTSLPEYKGLYAVVLDNVLSQEECTQLTHMAEQSAGAHCGDESVEKNGWKTAMVNAGRDKEFYAPDYRNSDRIIWDNETIVQRMWARIMQVDSMKEYFSTLTAEKHANVIGNGMVRRNERWVVSPSGPNERMRFLKYGAGQFFRSHCDGTYETPNGDLRSFFTLHLYLNDSAQGLGIKEPAFGFMKGKKEEGEEELLRGGATTFHSGNMDRRLDVDPMAGRVLIFQQRRLLHSGDDVKAGIKYTMRSDLMYGFQLDGDKEDVWEFDTAESWKVPWQ